MSENWSYKTVREHSTDTFKEKSKQTLIKNYGVEHISHAKHFKEQIKQKLTLLIVSYQ
jgi:hypothetical protein